MSKKRERRKASKVKALLYQTSSSKPVFRMPTPLLTAADVQKLEREAGEAGLRLVGVELCTDPACMDNDQEDK